MVKLQRTARGNYIVSIPKEYVTAANWQADEELIVCPDLEKRGILRLISTKRCNNG